MQLLIYHIKRFFWIVSSKIDWSNRSTLRTDSFAKAYCQSLLPYYSLKNTCFVRWWVRNLFIFMNKAKPKTCNTLTYSPSRSCHERLLSPVSHAQQMDLMKILWLSPASKSSYALKTIRKLQKVSWTCHKYVHILLWQKRHTFTLLNHYPICLTKLHQIVSLAKRPPCSLPPLNPKRNFNVNPFHSHLEPPKVIPSPFTIPLPTNLPKV